jgi:hypothetical protein
MLPRTPDGQITALDPHAHAQGPWQVSLDRRRCRIAPRGSGGPRYVLHTQVCLARDFGPRQGLCRGDPGCRAIVTLYGDDADLLCPACRTRRH